MALRCVGSSGASWLLGDLKQVPRCGVGARYARQLASIGDAPRGKVKATTAPAAAAKTGNKKRHGLRASKASGEVRRGDLRGAWRKGGPLTMRPLSGHAMENDCAQSHAVWKPIAHHSEPVRQRLRQKTRPMRPAESRPRGDSPEFATWPLKPKDRKERTAAAVQKPMDVGCAGFRSSRPGRFRLTTAGQGELQIASKKCLLRQSN